LIKAIETLVNRVRNRFSLVDLDAAYCPHSPTSAIRSDKATFLTGSCLLGASVNSVLFRDALTAFEPGELIVNTKKAAIPGRIIILRQTLNDMGGVRFTNTDRNMIFGVSDVEFPVGTDDEPNLEIEKYVDFYSKSGSDFQLEQYYVDQVRAYENIQMVDGHIHARRAGGAASVVHKN
jgi:hypothetical protein